MDSEMTAACRYRSGFTNDPSTYFEILEPLVRNGMPPVMMITGGVHTGACYLATADGRPGWAHSFLRRGFTVVLADWPGVGRSGFVSPEALSSRLIVNGLAAVLDQVGEPVVLMTHSISGGFGWKLLEEHPDRIAKLVAVAPASPGNMGKELGTLLRDEGNRKIVAMPSGETVIDLAETVSLDRAFAHAKLVGTSKRFPPAAFDSYFRSLAGISGRVMFERTNIGGGQLRVEDMAGFAGKPVLVVTGTDDVDHPRVLDVEIVNWLKQAGAHAEALYLSDIGIKGNGHMMMLEENSDEIAAAIIAWIGPSAEELAQ